MMCMCTIAFLYSTAFRQNTIIGKGRNESKHAYTHTGKRTVKRDKWWIRTRIEIKTEQENNDYNK